MQGRLMRRGLVGALVLGALLLSAAASARTTATAGPAAADATKPPTKQQLRAAGTQLVAAARRGGTLNFYTSADPVTAQKLADTFGKKYGIKVTFTRLTSGPIAARYTAEAQAGNTQADVVMIADPPFFANSLARGWMLPMKTWRDAPNLYAFPRKFKFYGSVGIGVSRLNGVVINTSRVEGGAVPTTWRDLAESRWSGRLIGGDPRSVPVTMGMWQLLRRTYGDGLLRSIAAQRVQYVASLVTGVQTVAAGERYAAFGANLLHMNPLLATAPNAPVRLIQMQGPDFGFVWNAGVSTRSPNPAAGRLFVNWLVSGEGQRLFNGPGNNATLPGVTVTGSPPLSDKFITVSAATSQENQRQILSLLGLSG